MPSIAAPYGNGFSRCGAYSPAAKAGFNRWVNAACLKACPDTNPSPRAQQNCRFLAILRSRGTLVFGRCDT